MINTNIALYTSPGSKLQNTCPLSFHLTGFTLPDLTWFHFKFFILEMDENYPETINGVCIKVEPNSPAVMSKDTRFDENFSLQKSAFENGTSEYPSGHNEKDMHDLNGRQTPSYSHSSSEFSGSGFGFGQSNCFDNLRKPSSPAFSDELKGGMSSLDSNYNTSTPSIKENMSPRVPLSYHMSKGAPPSMLGDSIYSYASFNENNYSKINMMLKTPTNGNDFDETDSKLNLTYPGTARPIGKKAHLPKRYKCAMCAYKTRYKSDLNRHVRKHAVAGYNCDICNMPFKTVGNVEFHKRREHADTYVATKQEKKPKFNCKLCTFGTMQSSELTRHVRKHYVAKFTCTLCNRPFMSSGSLVHHERSDHNMNNKDTPQNGENGDQASEQNGDHTEPIIESDDENYQTSTNKEHTQTDDSHNKSMSNEYEQSCGNTNGLSKTNAAVATNGNTFHNGDDLESKDDEMVNGIQDKPLTNGFHDDSKDDDGIAKHKCQFCNKSFGRKLVLDYHLKNIHKMKIREDDSAFLEYNDDYDLALDMSIQELENSGSPTQEAKVPRNVEREDYKHMRHQCPFCAYATNYKSTYDRHVKKHDLECHICHVCRMPFITYGHMQRHIRDNHPEYHLSMINQSNSEKVMSPGKDEMNGNGKPPLKMAFKRDNDRPFQSGVANYQAVALNGHADANKNFCPVVPSKRKKHPPIQRQMEPGVTMEPPTTGRFAKLVSDFDDFASRPFACALCFFRTRSVDELTKHTQNHLTGCNPQPVPDTARFNMAFMQQFQNKQAPKIERPEPIRPTIQHNVQSFRKPNHKLQDVISKLWNEPKPGVKMEEEPEEEEDSSHNISDSIVPTFSVHYRKDKTNLTRPYLCLLCRKRFRLLTILKQHFRQTHSESQINTKSYTCSICGELFNSPVLLQEHHDFTHKMQS